VEGFLRKKRAKNGKEEDSSKEMWKARWGTFVDAAFCYYKTKYSDKVEVCGELPLASLL